jgi:hypothetical protein
MQIHPPKYFINALSFEIQNVLKMCAGAFPAVVHICVFFVGSLTMLLHQTSSKLPNFSSKGQSFAKMILVIKKECYHINSRLRKFGIILCHNDTLILGIFHSEWSQPSQCPNIHLVYKILQIVNLILHSCIDLLVFHHMILV